MALANGRVIFSLEAECVGNGTHWDAINTITYYVDFIVIFQSAAVLQNFVQLSVIFLHLKKKEKKKKKRK